MTEKEKVFINGYINTLNICIKEDKRTLDRIESSPKGVSYIQDKTLLTTRLKEDEAMVVTLNKFLKLVDDGVLK